MENPIVGTTPASAEPVNPEKVSEANSMAANIQNDLKQQGENLSKAAKDQVSNLGNAMQGQVQNLGQAGVNQVQDMGKAGMAGLGGIVSDFTKPFSGASTPQPPVVQEEKIYATLAYIPFVSLVSLILKPDSAFVRLHAKQGLLLTVIFFFVGILAAIVSIFGLIGQLLSLVLGFIPLGCIIIGVYSMYLAMTGYWWKIPVLSSVSDLIPIEMLAKASKENITGQIGVAKNDYDNRQDTMKKEQAEVKPVMTGTSKVEQPESSSNGGSPSPVNPNDSGNAQVK